MKVISIQIKTKTTTILTETITHVLKGYQMLNKTTD